MKINETNKGLYSAIHKISKQLNEMETRLLLADEKKLYSRRKLESDNAKLIAALKQLKETWDISNPERVMPKIETDAMGIKYRNDSLAAAAILNAINLVSELEK
jgi:hypothetical protein